MRSLLIVMAAASLSAGLAAPSAAQEMRDQLRVYWHCYWRDYCRSKEWPVPFVAWDRQSTRAPWYTMVAKGWQEQNTLGEYDFRGGQLSNAGRQKVAWILTVPPPHHRGIRFVRGANDQETQLRRAAIEEVIASVGEAETVIPILDIPSQEPGWSAEYADQIDRKFRESAPLPRLPASTTNSEGDSF